MCIACDNIDLQSARALERSDPWQADDFRSIRYSTPYYKIFGGLTTSTITCNCCPYSSRRTDMFTCLSLAVPFKEKQIEEVLKNHWDIENLSDEGDYCRACKAKKSQILDVRLERWPRVLVIHLKRRIFVRATQEFDKNHTPVGFETCMLVPGKSRPYHLRAVIVHHGEAEGGHYTAFVKSVDNCWYDCDDWVSPRRVLTDEVLAAEAYMLFYDECLAWI